MYHVICNQHLEKIRRLTGPVLVMHRAGEDGERLRRHLRKALGDRPVTAVAADALAAGTLPTAGQWVVPVQVVRSRFSRGADRLSDWSRRLGERRSAWADRLNACLGAPVELVCGAPLPASDTDAIALAAAALQEAPSPPLVPAAASLWPGVQAALADMGTVAADSRAQLGRMANRYHLPSATLLRAAVHYVSRCFFRGIWISGLERIENLPPAARIVYLPCHRSHFDYMILPYALNALGRTSPIFAAGDNLNFFAIGRLLQSGFAFFIRRTFGNDSAYRNLCAAYVGEALQAGMPLSFFPEGGRSRDGWMRSPKQGLLQMVRERTGPEPVYAVPVHLAYEVCPDGKSLARQALGRAKRQESVFRFLKSLRMLAASHGRAFITIGEPIRLEGTAGRSEAESKAETASLLQHLLERINAHAVVTGPSLAAVALGARGHEASLETLVGDCALLTAYLEALAAATGWPIGLAPAPDSAPAAVRGVVRASGPRPGRPAADAASCRRHLTLLGLRPRQGMIRCRQPVDQARLDWYRGAIGHLLMPLGLVARHVAAGGTLLADDLTVLAARLDQMRQDPTLRLYWPAETPSTAVLAGVTAFLADHGHVAAADPAVWQRWAVLAPASATAATEGKAATAP